MLRNTFDHQLRLYGPGQIVRRYSLSEARSYCRHLALTHYENFLVASALLPRRLLRHFHAVYAYCRWADDLGDETGDSQQSLDLLRWWREQLLACYSPTNEGDTIVISPPYEGGAGGGYPHPVMIALRETIQEFNIPPKPFLDLILAFEQDQHIKQYETPADLEKYCAHSANPVGHLVLYLCGSYNEERARLSDSICTGLQLANFWQDVARDLDIGRIYLPVEDRRRFGYSDEDLHARRYNAHFAALMTHEVGEARKLLKAGQPLVKLMPCEFQPDIALFIQGGTAILDAIERIDYNVWQQRPKVGKLTQAKLLLQHIAPSLAPRSGGRKPPVSPAIAKKPGFNHPQPVAASYAYCSRLTRVRAGNFYYAFRILPRRQRRAMYALYSFMRIADDIADEPGNLEEKQARLADWESRLDLALVGQPSHPSHAALQHTVQQYGIPTNYLKMLLNGVRSDLTFTRPKTFADLYGYCYRVASVVGLACIRIWGCRDDRATPFAEAAGVAFQLTNILRDLAEDVRNGRLYLPQEDLARFGCSEEQLARGPCDEAYRQLLRFQIQRAKDYYEKALPLMGFLRPAGRAVFQIMLRLYRGLLDSIERQGFDRIAPPARLSLWKKLRFILQALPTRFGWT